MTFMERAEAFSDAELEQRATLLAALAHPVRLRIVDGLTSGACAVGRMVDCLGLPQPLVSRHLAVLRRAGVVRAERRGRVRTYRVVHPGAQAILRNLTRSLFQTAEPDTREKRAS